MNERECVMLNLCIWKKLSDIRKNFIYSIIGDTIHFNSIYTYSLILIKLSYVLCRGLLHFSEDFVSTLDNCCFTLVPTQLLLDFPCVFDHPLILE